MKYLILTLTLILIFLAFVVGCTEGSSTIEDIQYSCSPCKHELKREPVKLKEVMIEVQNNARECAVRVWSRASTRPLFEVKGAQGLNNCKVYVIHNADIKTKSNELGEDK